MAALEKLLERYRQAEKKSESAQQETDAPTKAAYKVAIKAFGQLQTAGLFPDDHPAIKTLKAELDQAKRRPVTNPCPSARGFEQARTRSPCMRETSKRPTIECRRPSRAQSLEQHRAKVEDIERALQERRNNLEQLSHGAEATQLQIMFPDGITKHLPQEAKGSLKKAADLYEEQRKAVAAAKEAAARPAKEAMELDEFGGLDDQEDPAPDPSAEARIQASIDELLQAQTRGDPERLAVLRAQMARDLTSQVPKKRPKQIVTINGNFWTTHAELAHVGPRHLVLGQEHRLEAGRCDEEAAKLERQDWRCGFTPAKRNALKAKTDSSLATSAGTFVAAPKHWELEWVWPARSWQSKELQDQGRLTMAWGTHSVQCLLHTEAWTERNQQLLEALSLEIRRCPGLWILAGDFNMEPRLLGNTPHPRDCQEFWSSQLHLSDMKRRFVALTSLWFTAQLRARFWKCACWRILASALVTQSR